MRDTGLQRKKAGALYSVYREGLEKGLFDSYYKAGYWCANHPAPCYFISAKRASILIGRLQAGDILEELHPSQRRKALDLWAAYNRYVVDHPGNPLSRERILEVLVDEPAPEFYLTAEAARKILRYEIRRRKQARRKRWYEQR